MSDAALAQEVKDLRDSIEATKTEHATAFTAAETTQTKVKEKYKNEPNVLAAMSDDDYAEIDAAFKAADTLHETIAKLDDRLKSTLARNGQTLILPTGADTPTIAAAQGMGERFLASEQYDQYKRSGFARGALASVEVASRDDLHNIFSAASDGAGLIPVDSQLGSPVNMSRRTVRVLDLITVLSTDTDAVEWSRQKTRTDAVNTKTAGGASSDESIYEWEKVIANIKRIPTHIVIPKSQLADQARLKGELEMEGRKAVALKTENLVIAGDGVGENFDGILGTAGIATVAKGADTVPDAVHFGITAVRIQLEDDITAIGVHPNDFEKYVLEKDLQGRYLSGRGPQDATASTMWGYPAVVSTAFTEGTIVPANWAGAYLWVRSGLTIESGYINAQLIQDLTTLAFEYRAAFAVKQPKAFATVTGVNA